MAKKKKSKNSQSSSSSRTPPKNTNNNKSNNSNNNSSNKNNKKKKHVDTFHHDSDDDSDYDHDDSYGDRSSSSKPKKALVLTIRNDANSNNNNNTSNNNNNNRRSKNVKEDNERVLHISEEDANRLNVSNGDPVIVTEVKSDVGDNGNSDDDEDEDEYLLDSQIIWDENGIGNGNGNSNGNGKQQPKFISVCKVHIIKSTQKKSGGFSSPKSPNSNTKHPISKGEAKVSPTFLSKRMFASNLNSSITTPMTVTSPQPTTTTIQPKTPTSAISTTSLSSTSTSTTQQKSTTPNFSFKSFVKSPSSTTKSPKLKTKTKTKTKVIILPLKYHEVLSKRLLLSSNVLCLRLVPNNTLSSSASSSTSATTSTTSTSTATSTKNIIPFINVLQRSKKLLERMIISVCHNEYLRYNDIITISFQGKRIQFEVFNSDGDSTNNGGTGIDDDDHEDDHEDDHDDELEQLNSSMAKMNLDHSQNNKDEVKDENDNDNDDDSISHEILSQFVEGGEKHILHYISLYTRIRFEFQGQTQEREQEQEHHIDPLSDKKETTTMTVAAATTTTTNSTLTSTRDMKKTRIVAGLDSVLDQIHAFLIPTLLHPELFPKSGPIRAPKGILLHGSSGCGKSLLASQVIYDIQSNIYAGMDKSSNNSSSNNKRIQVNTIHINCASIQATTSIIGEAERKLTKLFEKAEYRANEGVSTLLILDDVHLICPRRGAAGGSGGSDRVASTLLALMDGVGQSQNQNNMKQVDPKKVGNVAILAITTSPALLDPALRRAGRLDTETEVPNPDDNSRAAIFELILNELKRENICLPPLDSDVFMSYAKLAKGFTGGDCALCVKEAVRQALTHSNEQKSCDDVLITDADMRHAIKITKPSAIKSITVEIPSVPWSSIGGMDDVKYLLREAIELPMTHGHLFEALRIPPPRGVLLYGPPGCSKTLMARALATEGSMNFLTVKGPELLSKWLGESERQLASLFRRARLASPCVIFFDEIDAIASKRGSSESSGGERMLSQLLTELDGIGTMTRGGSSGSQPRVVVVGATNRPDLLDSALTRPGRIDRMIYVGLPDQDSREAIFQIQFKNRACDPDLNMKTLAVESGGFSGAEIVSICREAALYAIEEIDTQGPEEEPMIRMKHIHRSLKDTKRQITSQMLEFYKEFGSKK